ncbi:MAG: Mur ligase family protein, partial [Gemmatimonadales bacterium]
MTLPETWRRGVVAVIGLGRSGVAATRLLARLGVRVYASDVGSTPVAGAAVETLRALPGVELELGRHDLTKIRGASGVVVSPGVPPDAAPLAAARQAGVPVVSELDLGYQALPGVRCIAVTGTNGKTTTTALVAHLLRVAGLRVEAAGNIGRPLADIALASERPQWLAVEVSSFQLHDSPAFAPEIGVLTNLAPDHLDRYADVAHYYGDKRLLFRNATAASVWVVNGDDSAALALAAGAQGRLLRFSLRGPADGWYDAAERVLRIGGAEVLP